MVKYDDKLIERIYKGIYGKIIGVIYGAPVEMWDSEQIKNTYNINTKGYLVDYNENGKIFSADDDINGPVFFLNALEDYKKLTPETMAKVFKRYISTGHGFFWWGGYGISAEETAYRNILNGIDPNLSGSCYLNGKLLSSQIGGQIFSDFWGMLFPNDIYQAALYGKNAATITHDLDALEGGKFIPAMVSAAFTEKDSKNVILKALPVLDKNLTYYKVIVDILKFHEQNKNQEECFKYIKDNYWKDKYGGNCHIIPNIAIMIMSLLYGNNDFDETLKICVFSGFDTDCNAGNIGTILGVMDLKINDYWIKPINDVVVGSSVIGYKNIIDLPTLAYQIARHTFELNDKTYQGKYDLTKKENLVYDFKFANSTHGFIYNNKKYSKKTYYRPIDLYNNRYFPCFSPLIYPNQKAVFTLNKLVSGSVYYIDINDNVIIERPFKNINKVELLIDKADAVVGEVGIKLNEQDIKLINFEIVGKPNYYIDFNNTPTDTYDFDHVEVRGFTYDEGYFITQDNYMHASASEVGTCFTGKYLINNVLLKAQIINEKGDVGIIFGALGKNEYYLFKKSETKLILSKVLDKDELIIKEEKLDKTTKNFNLKVDVKDDFVKCYLDEKIVFQSHLPTKAEGLVGIYVKKGVSKIFKMEVEER